MKTKQHSVWDIPPDTEREKSTNDEDDREPCHYKTIAEGHYCCCPCSTATLIGFLLGVLTAGIALSVILSIYLAGSGKATNGSIVVTSKVTNLSTTSTSSTSTSSTSTTASTASTSTSTSTSSSTSTSTSTSTTTTTSTTNVPCGSTCINFSISTSSRLAFYSFDNVITDGEGTYPLNGIASPAYLSGWVGSAISFNAYNAQLLSTGHIPLDTRSFSVNFWFYATDVNHSSHFVFAGERRAMTRSQCLFISIRYNYLYIGFYYDDTSGNTHISANQWHHAAFVYDNTTNEQRIYLNGVLDGSSSTMPLQTTTGNFTIGGAYMGGAFFPPIVYYSGYIDHFTISSRAKSACEVYLDAVLACYFTFDSASPFDDSGPNFISATNIGTTSTIGRVNQALQFSSVPAHITISGISALISTNTAFTISMWLNPTTVSSGGQGSCLVMWGLTSTGLMSVNVIDSSNNTIPATTSFVFPINTWTHVAQTFSRTHGNYLYINGTFVTSASAPTGRPIGPYVILGAPPNGTSSCPAGLITTGQFSGSIDEFRVFGRELSSIDIYRLANP